MSELTRRSFALAGAAAALMPQASAKLAPLTPGIKISMQWMSPFQPKTSPGSSRWASII